jgi:hypothetical protein
MRKLPQIFPLLLTLAFATPLLAEDWTKKDPASLAKEAKKIAADLRKEAEYFQSSTMKTGRALTSDEQKYLNYTLEEAELLEKSYEAWDKNQIRMADKHREKAAEFCQKRGEMATKLKLWEKKEEAPAADKKPPGDADKASKIAEIERQQAELERKKKELEQSGKN